MNLAASPPTLQARVGVENAGGIDAAFSAWVLRFFWLGDAVRNKILVSFRGCYYFTLFSGIASWEHIT